MRALLVLAVVLLLTACQPSRATWEDIPPTPGAEAYAGPDTARLDERVASRVTERRLAILGDRVEKLPVGTTWDQHVFYREGHSQFLYRVRDTVPEPDAPVLYAEWSRASRTLVVVGVRGADGRLVVRTTLLEPA